MKNNIRVDSCDHIVQDNSKSSFESFLEMTDRKGFKNVEKPKEEKSDDHEEERLGNPEHRDEKAYDLVDDYLLIIFFPKKNLSIF